MTLAPGEIVAGKYRIDSLLGQGGMGTVYVATNERLWKKVALKVLSSDLGKDAELAARFTREAIAASTVSHPGVVQIYDADVHDGTPWIAMELLEGESLASRLTRGPMSVSEAIGTVREALEALSAVHRAGIVHRDLKPDNLFLEKLPGGGQRVKVLDFGIAKFVDPQMGGQTQTGAAMGTPHFLAPEQATSSKDVDARADVYSVGSILFHALSGELPYEADTFGDLVRKMFTGGPRSLAAVAPSVPANVSAIVDRCLAVDPAQRPSSADELIRLLDQALESPAASATPRTVALDAERLKREIGVTAAAPGAGWHPAPESAAPVGSGGGFGVPPQGPASAVGPAPARSSGAGGALIAFGAIAAIALIGITAVGVVAGAFFYMRSAAEPVVVEDEYDPEIAPSTAALGLAGVDAERLRVDVTDRMPQRGPDDAPVTIVMFSDYQCPFCSRVEPTLTRLLEAHPGQVRIVWRDNPLPFHQDAMLAAEAAREAYAQGGDERYWQMHDVLFENQRALARADLEGYATRVGLDATRFRAALDAHSHQASIREDMAATSRAGARGTPAFFLNGRKLMGAQPFESFETVVNEEIAIANALIARGVPRAQIYAHHMRDARETPSPEGDDAPTPTPTPARAQPDPNAIYRVPLGSAPTIGPDDALVTIVAFSEFQCPFCSRVRPTLDEIRERYGSDVRIAFKHNPLAFHSNAMPAAEAAMEVQTQRGDEAFWRYHDVLFENQRELTRENLETWARREGVTSVGAALDDHRHRAAIEADQQLARSLGASGTPSFFINGRNLRGAQPFPAFASVIDEELRRARAEVERGTPRRAVYEALIRDGATSPRTLAAPAAAPTPPTPGADTVYAIAVPPGAPSRGPASAPVTIQLFSDFQCPFCSRIGPTLRQVQERYPTQVRIVWRDYPLPFHTNAMLAAEAAREIHAQRGSDAFWRYHDALFENQRDLERPTLERLAQELGGVDMPRFRRALDQHTHRPAVGADMRAITDAGARIGTPSSFINGRLLQGAQPFPAFQTAIDRELAR